MRAKYKLTLVGEFCQYYEPSLHFSLLLLTWSWTSAEIVFLRSIAPWDFLGSSASGACIQRETTSLSLLLFATFTFFCSLFLFLCVTFPFYRPLYLFFIFGHYHFCEQLTCVCSTKACATFITSSTELSSPSLTHLSFVEAMYWHTGERLRHTRERLRHTGER